MSDHRRVLLKLSGEALAGEKKTGFDEETVRKVAAQVKRAADEGVDAGEVDIVLRQGLEDAVAPVRELVGYGRELGELRGLVGHVLGEDGLVALEEADLGGGGAGVDGQDAIGHGYLTACARTQLMATLPTISLTGALRLQSHTILEKPCSMGP